MPNIIHIIWFLLPLAFFLMAAWSALKPLFQVAGRENIKDYLSQGVFCSLALLVAVYVDKTEYFEALLDKLSYGDFDLRMARILLYPAVLLVMAQLQQLWKRDKSS